MNRRGGELHGVRFVPGPDGLPDPPDHVVIVVPPQQVRPLVIQGLAARARCFTVITSGGTSAAEESELAALITGGGARLLGPNCMVVVDTTSGLRLSWGDFPAGSVGLVSQSGNLALEIGRLLARAGQGFSRFVSLGNQRDIDAADALDALVAQGTGGSVLSLIATYAWHGHPGTVHSAAAKAGVLAMTRTLAVELASLGIRLNCIAPRPTETAGAGAPLWATEEARAEVLATVRRGASRTRRRSRTRRCSCWASGPRT